MEANVELKHPYLNRRRRSIINEFFRVTSIHGLPAIARAYGPKNRFCWSLMFFVFFVIMLYFIVISVLTYFTYPTQTNVDQIIEYPMSFPAVTICNYAIIRYDLTIGPFINYLNSSGLISSNTSTGIDLSNPMVGLAMGEFFIDVLNKNENFADYALSLNELLFSCTYNNLPCNTSDFVQFTSPKYGICYTFNAKTDSMDGKASLRTTTDNGGQGVLQLEFFIYDHLNFPYLTDGVGMIAMLHDNTQIPQIEIDGVGLVPSRKHTLQFLKETISFLGAPYTNCTTTTRSDMKTMFETSYTGAQYQYSRQMCLNLCAQAYVYSVCNCTSPIFWNARSVLLPNGTVIFAQICQLINPCVLEATLKLINDLTMIEQQCSHCTSECQLTSFQVQLSSIMAPALSTRMAMKQWLERNSLINSSRAISLPTDWSTNSSTYLNRNYVGLRVALGTILVNRYTQSATLSWAVVISNAGGQTGLWIGVSMLSLIELLEMLYRLIRLRLSKMKKKKQITPEG